MYSKNFLIIACFIFISRLYSQYLHFPEYAKYDFINDSLNIVNPIFNLHNFYTKLQKLENKENLKVSVLHIGDSHIQGDFFPKKLRHCLQYYFGNAGRGLIFPLKLAKTNEPLDFKILSNIEWIRKKNLNVNNPLPIGICGYTLRSEIDTVKLRIILLEKDSIKYNFNKFTLIHQKGDTCYSLKFYDGNENFISKVCSDEISLNIWTTVIETDSAIKELQIITSKDDENQQFIQIYGIVLENDQSGIIYHSVGVNGADFFHYNRSKLFFEQIPILEPDLIIVSLGTNDALFNKFNIENFKKELSFFVKKLKEVCPNSSILLTTPGDCSPKNNPNENIKTVKDVIINFAKENGISYWDLYSIMGGQGAIIKWYKNGLALKDKIHLNKKGYEIQGELLFNALMNGYRSFKHRF